MIAIVSLSRARTRSTISAARASVSRTTLAADPNTGPKTRTFTQTVSSSSAAMGVRRNHQTSASGIRHHNP
eukprot:6213822-Pleurochrysis_carterae.AAC.1